MKAAVIITNYNTWSLTIKCIQELIRWSERNISKIIVVDDCSKDMPALEIPPKALVIRNDRNLGYVASVNVGLSNLENEDIVIMLDSDAYPLADIISPLIKLFMKTPRLGVVGMGSAEHWPSVKELALGKSLYSLLANHSIFKNPRYAVSSCAFAVRREAIKEVGIFDEEFDFLDADIDYCMRLYEAKWTISYDPSLSLYHEGGGSYQAISTRVIRWHKNRWHLLTKHKMIRCPNALKVLLTTRHIVEYLILLIIGKYLYQESCVLKEKIYCRKILIKTVWREYSS